MAWWLKSGNLLFCQPRSQSSSAIPDVTSPIKLNRMTRFSLGTRLFFCLSKTSNIIWATDHQFSRKAEPQVLLLSVQIKRWFFSLASLARPCVHIKLIFEHCELLCYFFKEHLFKPKCGGSQPLLPLMAVGNPRFSARSYWPPARKINTFILYKH